MVAIEIAQRVRPAELIRAWLEANYLGEETIELGDVVAAGLERFRDDEVFLAALVATVLPELIGVELRALLHGHRGHLPAANSRIPTAQFEEEVARKLSRWYEHAGANYRNLLHMAKPELIENAELRERQAHGLLRIAGFERELANGLPDDATPVGRFYTPGQIEQIWRNHA